MFNKFPKRTGIYRINDNIEQLQLRLRLKHINSLLELPKFDLNKNGIEKWWQRQHSAADRNDDEDQEVSIKWQEKILSVHEMKRYKEASNCVTETQKRYRAWLLAGGGARVSDDDTSIAVSDKESSSRLRLRKRIRGKENSKQHQAQREPRSEATQHIFTYIDEDKHRPAAEAERAQHAKDRHLPALTSEMYVYATLQSSDTLLITLRWYADAQLLHVYPDFSDFHDRPYYVQIDADYRHLYAYGFRNASPTAVGESGDAAHQSPAFPQLPPHLPLTHWQTEQQLASEFAMPAGRGRRTVLLLEIRQAREFAHEPLHVRYHARLPAHLRVEEGLLHASTQASAAERGTHHFGHCWQLTLLSAESESVASDVCHLFFEVISIDGWQRERVEGYAYCAYALQATSTVDCRRLRCLRPAGGGFMDKLNRYFIGGRQHFDLERFFLCDAAAEASPAESSRAAAFHSRYGWRMQQTGELLVSCQRLTQRKCELLQPCIDHPDAGMTLDDIMLAYREARKRLEAIVLEMDGGRKCKRGTENDEEEDEDEEEES